MSRVLNQNNTTEFLSSWRSLTFHFEITIHLTQIWVLIFIWEMTIRSLYNYREFSFRSKKINDNAGDRTIFDFF